MSRQPLRNAKERLRRFLSECGRRARLLRLSLRRQPDRIDPSSRFAPGFRYGYGKREARGLDGDGEFDRICASVRRATAIATANRQRHLTPSCGGIAPTAERTVGPARMIVGELDTQTRN